MRGLGEDYSGQTDCKGEQFLARLTTTKIAILLGTVCGICGRRA